MARTRKVKANKQIKSKGPADNKQATARTGSAPQPTVRTGTVPQATANVGGNPQLSAATPSAMPQPSANIGQVGPAIPTANLGSMPQMGPNAGIPNNINNQQGVVDSVRPQRQAAPVRKRAKVKSTRSTKKATPKSAPAKSQSASSEEGAKTPTFNFFFAGKAPA